MSDTDRTHDAALRSWVESANAPDTDFPVQNLPYGVFRRAGGAAQGGVAIGTQILDLGACVEAGLFEGRAATAAAAAAGPTLNPLMALGAPYWHALRTALSAMLSEGGAGAEDLRAIADRALVAMADATLVLPAAIGDFTDFYASLHHATNAGRMFRPDNPLMPNYKHMPIAYHGRASSVIAAGTGFRRPQGQRKAPDAALPSFGPCRQLDYELEMGAYIGPGNAPGEPIALAVAGNHVFGLCVLNDWSARDIQAWEYQPLGPFLGKNFASTVSPWIVTLEALAPFRVPGFERAADDPSPLPYLSSAEDAHHGGLDVALEVSILSAAMRAAGLAPHALGRSRFRDMYWTVFQMVAHHASNGCNLRPGDLLGSGTCSGETADSYGSLLELTARGSRPVTLPGGETRGFLEDGDEVIMRGICRRDGFAPIGFGECRATILPAAG
jgi:fumarylacetoacetase